MLEDLSFPNSANITETSTFRLLQNFSVKFSHFTFVVQSSEVVFVKVIGLFFVLMLELLLLILVVF
jgi:hypothetical protein